MLRNRKARRLILETPMILTCEKKNHSKIFDSILNIAVYGGLWGGKVYKC